jgi:hypothetical protein
VDRGSAAGAIGATAGRRHTDWCWNFLSNFVYGIHISQPVRKHGEPPPFVTGEPKAVTTQVTTKDSVFLDRIGQRLLHRSSLDPFHERSDTVHDEHHAQHAIARSECAVPRATLSQSIPRMNRGAAE